MDQNLKVRRGAMWVAGRIIDSPRTWRLRIQVWQASLALAKASFLPGAEVSRAVGLSGGLPGWGAGWGTLALGVLEVSCSCPLGLGLDASGAAGTTGPKVSTGGARVVTIVTVTAATDDS